VVGEEIGEERRGEEIIHNVRISPSEDQIV